MATALGLVLVSSALAQETGETELSQAELRAEALHKEVEAYRAHIKMQADNAAKMARDAAKMKAKVIAGANVRHEAKAAMRDAAANLRSAETDADKEQAEARLRELLTKYFEHDMTQRQSELKEMETRLRKLEEQLERRREKMEEIIDLQVQVLVNQADGLGFFNESEANDFVFKMGWEGPGPFKIAGPATFEVPIAMPAPPAAQPFAAPRPADPADVYAPDAAPRNRNVDDLAPPR
jgi:hypothetical protein